MFLGSGSWRIAIAFAFALGIPARTIDRAALAQLPGTGNPPDAQQRRSDTVKRSDPQSATTATGLRSTRDTAPFDLDGLSDLANPRAILKLLPEKSLAAVLVYPQMFLNSKPVRSLPTEFICADLKRTFGLDFKELHYALVFLEEHDAGVPAPGVIAHSRRPIDWRRIPDANPSTYRVRNSV